MPLTLVMMTMVAMLRLGAMVMAHDSQGCRDQKGAITRQ